jgi:hypothetical protein
MLKASTIVVSVPVAPVVEAALAPSFLVSRRVALAESEIGDLVAVAFLTPRLALALEAVGEKVVKILGVPVVPISPEEKLSARVSLATPLLHRMVRPVREPVVMELSDAPIT